MIHQPPSERQVHSTRLIAGCLLTIALLISPVAQQQLPDFPIFLPFYIALVCGLNLVTSYLLFNQFRITASLPVLLLASVYLATAIITLPHLLTFPSALTFIADPNRYQQASIWFWVYWHSGFPLGLLLYSWLDVRYKHRPIQQHHIKPAIFAAVFGVLVVTSVLIYVTLNCCQWLLPLIDHNEYSHLNSSGVGPVVWLITALALLTLKRQPETKNALHLWLCCALFTALIDITITLTASSRYTLGWYAARITSLFSASIVFGAIIHEINSLYVKVSQSEIRFRTFFASAGIGMAIVDMKGRYSESNASFQQFLGYSAAELQQLSFADFTHPADNDKEAPIFHQLINNQIDRYQMEKRFYHRNGSILWGHLTASLVRDPSGQPLYVIRMIEDISQRKQAEATINHMAYHDALTGLPNRRMFRQCLEEALQQNTEQQLLGVAFLDLDRFKYINDTFGHDAGDQLLQAVAERISACLRPADLVARMGGDEFTLLLPTLATAQEATAVAERIIRALREPFSIGGEQLEITTSIGLAFAPLDGDTARVLMKKADSAMYQAKYGGKNRWQAYQADTDL